MFFNHLVHPTRLCCLAIYTWNPWCCLICLATTDQGASQTDNRSCQWQGALNLASRDLPCLPSALFEIHLGIKPEPLKSVPVEPPISTSTTDEISAGRRRGGQSNAPSWYEAQDLEVLKAWSNEIVEIQPEISMFGSLKTIDVGVCYDLGTNHAHPLF